MGTSCKVRYFAFAFAISILYSGLSHARTEKFQLPLSTTSRHIEVEMVIPDVKIGTPRMPALLIFGGFENAGEVLKLIKTNEPILLASFDYPYKGPRKYTFTDAVREAPALKQAMHDTIEGISVLFEYLSQRADVDPAQIGIVGASFGAPFALIATAEQPQIRRLVLVHGFADLKGTIQGRLEQAWRRRLGFFTKPISWLAATIIVGYLNPPHLETKAAELKKLQKVLVIHAEKDQFIPRQSTELLIASLRRSEAEITVLQTPGEHLMPGSDQLIFNIVQHVRDWLRQNAS